MGGSSTQRRSPDRPSGRVGAQGKGTVACRSGCWDLTAPPRVCSVPSPSSWRPGTGTTTPPQMVSEPRSGWAVASCCLQGLPQGTKSLTPLSHREYVARFLVLYLLWIDHMSGMLPLP